MSSNAIQPLITRLLKELGQPPLTLISDRLTYGDAYRAKYPEAELDTLCGERHDVRRLLARRPPLLLLVAEIPCRLHDAPCRFSFAVMHGVRQAGAPIVAVNGWLYGYAPPSRMDAIEHALFSVDYLRAFNLMLVQTPAVREQLIAAGADAQRVVVTGNIKFDAVRSARAASGAAGAAPLRDALLARRDGPVIVAGSVSELADQRALLLATLAVRRREPGAMLVLAPRHPENAQRMAALAVLLAELRIDYRLRSRCTPDEAAQAAVLVLDTIGELGGCYAAARLAFVSTDHNVLEPLAFHKPVFVFGGWEPTYPSYPVYRQLLDAGVLRAVDDPSTLGAAWLAELERPAAATQAPIDTALAQREGAVERSMQALRRLPRLDRLWAAPATVAT